jgi:hypothetical protein
MTAVLIGTADGVHEVDGGVTGDLAGREVRDLAPDDGGWWAVAGAAIVHRPAEGREWKEVAEVRDLRPNCILPTAHGVLIGTSEAHLLRLAGEGDRPERVDAFERVQGREDWYTPWGSPPDTRSLSAGPDGTLYANVHVGGIVRSIGGGDTWEPTIDIDADVHQVLAHPETPGLVLAATALGLATSKDAGDTWTFHTDGLHATYLRAVAVAGDSVLVTASTGPRGSRAAVYRRPLSEDGPFEQCRAGLPEWFLGNIDTGCLAARRDLAAFGTEEGSVFRSLDGGASWAMTASGLAPVRSVLLG